MATLHAEELAIQTTCADSFGPVLGYHSCLYFSQVCIAPSVILSLFSHFLKWDLSLCHVGWHIIHLHILNRVYMQNWPPLHFLHATGIAPAQPQTHSNHKRHR